MTQLMMTHEDAWERISGDGRTYRRPLGVVKVMHGKTVQVIVPVVCGYECEDVQCDILDEPAFLKRYSWRQVTGLGEKT